MGSLRNPIGPLPSSIYWRRRAVALVVLALLALVVVWALFSGDGDNSSRNEGKGGKGNGPASTITPGPTDSGPVNSQRPGGRDEEDGGSEGSGGSGGSGSSSGSGADDQSSTGGTGWGAGPGTGTGTGAADGGSGAGGSGGAGGAGGGGNAALPAPPSLASCEKSDVKLKLRSVEKEYGPGEKPKFELKAVNERDSDCKIDLGRTATIVTITNSDDAKFWASDDCPPDKKPMLRQVPANGDSVHTLTWFRKASAANCGTPTFESPKPGTYEIEVKVKGLKKVHTSFKIVK
ncbi:hypothetical protein OIE63_17500 [Streptomyces sp. NBC_01795]|uniref:hypothetical protein n=1 Tax=unclassified Streptomyces TaxID=2593676 RepID=UPI002DD9839A|nr:MULTISPECIES: hypothetical protein [unclassified Streptomyces]WSA93171.1 hypothetical protein OIE63_17500 [Streptomyces sp. NBC_01795]WSB77542.1 hypothetical protein OHB04_18335 [Streptomyces sp. NBC_01775]WSS14192.1 hypothetical protein OG533_21625 [Streptomyces sp. NBC_01186]